MKLGSYRLGITGSFIISTTIESITDELSQEAQCMVESLECLTLNGEVAALSLTTVLRPDSLSIFTPGKLQSKNAINN